ncbi:MAG TPA: tetratricopeptide repeat protein [Terracidiphilus sp.]
MVRFRLLIFTLVAILLFSIPVDAYALPSPQQAASSSAGDELNEGVSAYKAARYDEAIGHFRRATELAPDNAMAKVYLATALAQNVVPALDTPDNLKVAQQAIEMFQQVLAGQPHDINSLKQVAAVYFSVKKLDEARDWQMKVLNEDPTDPEAAYTIGVIDWTKAHQNALKILIAAGLNDDGEGNSNVPANLLSRIRNENADLVEEGLRYLQQAIANRPNYDDAMAYVNLVYRRKADLDFDNPKARGEDVAMAKEWMNKAMAARKANEEEGVRHLVSAPQ